MKLILLWLIALFGSLAYLVSYSQNPGKPTLNPPLALPVDFKDSSQLAKMIVFLHPECSCSQSTISELERLLPILKGKVQITAVFMNVTNKSSLLISDLYQRVADIGLIKSRIDIDGKLSKRFGAQTSGAVLLYEANDQLVFNGGLTSARAHEGTSVGNLAIREWALSRETIAAETAVYGCHLHNKLGDQ